MADAPGFSTLVAAALAGGLAASLGGACTGGQGAGGAAASAVAPANVQPTDGVTRLAPVEPREPGDAQEHAVFSLIDNRWLAHVEQDGALVVPAGSPGFAKYLRFGRPRQPWRLGQEQDGRRVARLERRARLDLPLTDAQAAGAPSLTLSVHAPAARKLELAVNGKPPKQVTLVAGWQVVTVPLTSGAFVAGENTVALDAGGGKPLSLEWLRVGGAAPDGAVAPVAAPTLAEAGLRLRPGDALAWYVYVPERARLRVDVSGAGCELVADVRAHEVATIAGPSARLDLAPLAGKVARLELRIAASAAKTCTEATITRAALHLPGPAAVAKRPAQPKYVVFWIMDTLRYDRVPLWFPGAVAEVPNLTRLADSGTVFLNHYPGGNESTVSHASMFTSLRPSVHRVVAKAGYRWKFEKGWNTIGLSARAAGMYVAGVTANGHIVKPGGYGWGFDVYENPMAEGKHEKDYGYGGDKILARALELVAKRKDDPFFLYIGTIDTHVPWRAYEPWVSRYDAPNGTPYEGKFKRVATAGGIKVSLMLSRTPPEPRDAERLAAIYASDVSFQDELVGKLLAQLEAWGILDETMIIVTGDHGEEFWEHGIAGHGGSLREPVVHVPMLVWYPPLFPRAVVDEGSEGVDILPTVLDALGVPLPPELQGASLVPLAQGVGRGYPRPAIASHWEAANALRMGRWKLVAENDGDSRLWDVAADPEERTELGAARPRERRWMIDAYSMARVHESAWRKSTWGTGANMTAQAARELESRP